MNNQATFFGGGTISPFLHALSRKNIFLTIFYNNPIMCFMHTFPMKLEYSIYYSSPDPFCYVVSALFLYAEYEEPSLITL